MVNSYENRINQYGDYFRFKIKHVDRKGYIDHTIIEARNKTMARSLFYGPGLTIIKITQLLDEEEL